MERSDAEIESAAEALIAGGVLAPLVLGAAEERAWMDCEIASLAELRLGERVDARALVDPQRTDLRARSTTNEREWPPSARSFDRCFWVLAEGRRAGTVALATSALGNPLIRLSSLYLYPEERGRGVARGVIEGVAAALDRHELGLRLETYWTVQRTLRFYVGIGMWGRMWKREIELCTWARAPRPWVELSERVATLSVEIDGERTLLVRAERDRDRLVAFDEPWRAESGIEPAIDEVAWNASTTLAIVLALEGWPLLHDPATWKRGWHGDAGHPEGLAHRIICWEAWAADHGWCVDAPRVPGLPYATWQELEAAWRAEAPDEQPPDGSDGSLRSA